jgi:hypothetical protein
VQLPPHLVPEEPNITAWVRAGLYLACLLPYVRFWVTMECTPGNGGKYTVRLLLIPVCLFLLLMMVAALGKATDTAENLQVILIVPGLVGVVCLMLIEWHRREIRK